jgi:tetratricopeptide (TPR) repeat protein
LRAAGDAARDNGRWQEAARFYEEVIKIDASAFDIAVQLGHAYKEMGNYDRTAELYFSTLAHKLDDDDLHLQIGHLEKMRGNFAKAMHHYKEALDLNSKNSDAQREYQALLLEKAKSERGLSIEALVQSAYRGVLKRDAEPQGIEVYGNALGNGMPLADLIAELIRTPEFLATAGLAPVGGGGDAAELRRLAAAMERAMLTLAIGAAREGDAPWRADLVGKKSTSSVDRRPAGSLGVGAPNSTRP